VPLFRREKLHERMAREGGLDEGKQPEPIDTRPRWGEVGIHGVQRPRKWDVVVTAEAPGLEGDDTEFTSLPGGTLVIDEGVVAEDLEPLVLAVESVLDPPYRAEAVRRHGDVWAVAAREIEIAELPDVSGEELILTMQDGTRSLTVDGSPEFGSVPALERLAGQRFDSYVATATWLDGDVWEVRISPL
jgi:hypothetical protein